MNFNKKSFSKSAKLHISQHISLPEIINYSQIFH